MAATKQVTIPDELNGLTNELDEAIETLTLGNERIESTALRAAKYIFDQALETEKESKQPIDKLLSSLTRLHAPRTRSQTKANDPVALPSVQLEPTPLTSLFVEGMDTEQIWMQLDLRAQSLCNLLEFALEGGAKKNEDEEFSADEEGQEDEEDELEKALKAFQNGEEVDLDALRAELSDDSLDLDLDDDDDDDEDESDTGHSEGEDVVNLQSPDDEGSEDNESAETLFDVITKHTRSRKQKPHNLDDGFFDLDAFNAETERAEAKSSSRGRLADDEDDEDDEDMSVDLYTPIEDGTDGVDDTEEIFYNDFFEPPQKNVSRTSKKTVTSPRAGRVRFHDEVRVKKIKAKGKSLPLSYFQGLDSMIEDEAEESEEEAEDEDEEDEETMVDAASDESNSDDDSEHSEGSEQSEEDNRKAIERFKTDLFAEDDDVEMQDDLTTHERRQAALQEQIAQLEAENVAKKNWALMGEADSRSRPQNSLLEEDLDYDRTMKPVPVITEEVVQGLEQRIKARILEGRFDDVVRIRPLDDKPFLPSRLFQLQDTKSTQSLAEIYENEYISSQGGGMIDGKDAKLMQEHQEIEQQWEKICHKLDALCNAHFVPKQPKAVISTVSNVATAAMESALPVARATSTMLAPEEVFGPTSSDTRSRSELTPAEKRSLRAKERKTKKKQRDLLNKSVDKAARVVKGIGDVKKAKSAALQQIVKTGKGVTVIGKDKKSPTVTSKKKQRS